MWRSLIRVSSAAFRQKATGTHAELRDFPGLCLAPACPSSLTTTRNRYGWQTPSVQQSAPEFKGTALLPNGEFKEINLADYKGKYVVLFFYPLDFTFVCPTEIIEFSDAAPEFEKINTQIIACSCDSHYSHYAWTKVSRKDGGIGQLNIPILADFTKKIAREYGVLLEEEGVALRGLFIIDPEQKVRQITINDLPVGRSASETLRLVQAFQFNAKYGEVCPASWRPGSKTIKPTPQESGEYFSESAGPENQKHHLAASKRSSKH